MHYAAAVILFSNYRWRYLYFIAWIVYM